MPQDLQTPLQVLAEASCHASSSGYHTPDTIVYSGAVNVEDGMDDVRTVMQDSGKVVRKRKRALALQSPFRDHRGRRFSRKKPPTFKPKLQPNKRDLVAFNRWLGGDDGGVESIRAGDQNCTREWFKRLVKDCEYLDSEHVDNILYLFRKRMDKFPDLFPADACILSDYFSQLVGAMAVRDEEDITAGTKEPGVYVIVDMLKEYVDGIRPSRGQPWYNKTTFYIPWNYENKHWILLVVDLNNWTTTVYDCLPGYFEKQGVNLSEMLGWFNMYFPYMLLRSGKFNQYGEKLKEVLKLTYAPKECVGLMKKCGNCGAFVLRTIEFHLAGKLENAAKEIHDAIMPQLRKLYAVQVYCNSADIC